MTTTDLATIPQIDIAQIIAIARKAGEAILDIYANPLPVEVEQKADNSPITIADKASNAVIISGLQEYYPNIPYISEETKQVDFEVRQHWHYCWLIDPLDGTKEFIKRNGEFTVNIALLQNGSPILSVVYAPVLDAMYFAEKDKGSWRIMPDGQHQRLAVRPPSASEPLRIFASRSHLDPQTEAFIASKKAEHPAGVELVSAGSSLKFCWLAEGKGQYYPRFAPTMEWDTAAGHLVATEANACLTTYPDLTEMRYNKADLRNPFFLLQAIADAE